MGHGKRRRKRVCYFIVTHQFYLFVRVIYFMSAQLFNPSMCSHGRLYFLLRRREFSITFRRGDIFSFNISRPFGACTTNKSRLIIYGAHSSWVKRGRLWPERFNNVTLPRLDNVETTRKRKRFPFHYVANCSDFRVVIVSARPWIT